MMLILSLAYAAEPDEQDDTEEESENENFFEGPFLLKRRKKRVLLSSREKVRAKDREKGKPASFPSQNLKPMCSQRAPSVVELNAEAVEACKSFGTGTIIL